MARKNGLIGRSQEIEPPGNIGLMARLSVCKTQLNVRPSTESANEDGDGIAVMYNSCQKDISAADIH